MWYLIYVYLIDFFNFQPLKIMLTYPYNEVPPTHHFYMSLVVRKPDFCICEIKDADQLRGNRKADQRLCFRYTDSTIPLLPKSWDTIFNHFGSELNPIFQASIHLIRLYSPVCVGPGRKPLRPVFSQRGYYSKNRVLILGYTLFFYFCSKT